MTGRWSGFLGHVQAMYRADQGRCAGGSVRARAYGRRMADSGAGAGTSIFFPLRTSVELFEDRTSPAAVVRAKVAAVLYDRVIFEMGMFDATISSGGSFALWRPPDALTPDVRKRARQVIPLGEPVTFAIGKQEAQGVPAPPEAMRVVSARRAQRPVHRRVPHGHP